LIRGRGKPLSDIFYVGGGGEPGVFPGWFFFSRAKPPPPPPRCTLWALCVPFSVRQLIQHMGHGRRLPCAGSSGQHARRRVRGPLHAGRRCGGGGLLHLPEPQRSHTGTADLRLRARALLHASAVSVAGLPGVVVVGGRELPLLAPAWCPALKFLAPCATWPRALPFWPVQVHLALGENATQTVVSWTSADQDGHYVFWGPSPANMQFSAPAVTCVLPCPRPLPHHNPCASPSALRGDAPSPTQGAACVFIWVGGAGRGRGARLDASACLPSLVLCTWCPVRLRVCCCSTTYTIDDMCGAPANTTAAWMDPGFLHTAVIAHGFTAPTTVYYMVSAAQGGGWVGGWVGGGSWT
jgi:hypothetical protein